MRRQVVGVACLLLMGVVASPGLGQRRKPYTVWFEDAMRKVPERPVPEDTASLPRTFHLGCARNERESFQVVVGLRGRGHGPISIWFGDLVCEEGEGRIPRENVSIGRLQYVKYAEPEGRYKYQRRYPTNITFRLRTTPDRIVPVPIAQRFAKDLQRPGNKPYLVTIYVPPETPAGEYIGIIRVTVGDQGEEEMRYTLTVWDFTLPKTSHFLLSVGAPRGLWYADHERSAVRLFSYGGKPGREYEAVMQLLPLRRKIMRDVAEHRASIRMVLPPPRLRFDGDEPILDWQDFDREASFAIDELGMSGFQVPYAYVVLGHGARYSKVFGPIDRRGISAEFERKFTNTMRAIARHLKEKGWFDRFVARLFDEPYPELYEQVKALARMLEAADPDFRPTVFGPPPVSELAGFIEQWSVNSSRILDGRAGFNWEAIYERMQAGEAVGFYNPWPSYTINRDPAYTRTLYWYFWLKKINRLGQWCIGAWNQPSPVAVGDFWSWWVWPANDTIPYFGSIRWEMTGDGIEDYDYLSLLAAAEGRETAEKICRQVAADYWERPADPAVIRKLRLEMATRIVKSRTGR